MEHETNENHVGFNDGTPSVISILFYFIYLFIYLFIFLFYFILFYFFFFFFGGGFVSLLHVDCNQII